MGEAGLGEGSPPTRAEAAGRAWGGSAARSLYLLENEGFHSSDEGHKRMKHKHSRNSKPQGENPDAAQPWGWGGSLAPGSLGLPAPLCTFLWLGGCTDPGVAPGQLDEALGC